jgi:hypothetical protein
MELGWKQNTCSINIPAFSTNQGLSPNSAIIEDSSPVDFFCLFFNSEILTGIHNETDMQNKKSVKGDGSPLKTKSVRAQWKDVDLQEIKVFFVVIRMCLVRKPYLYDYWRTDPFIWTAYANSIGMSRDRFTAILTLLHLNDNENCVAGGQPGYDPLFKVQPVLRNLTEKFQIGYTLDEILTIGRAICAFQGCIHFRVYMKGKPHTYGIKIFKLCEARSRCVCNLEVCASTHATEPDHSCSFNVVDRL